MSVKLLVDTWERSSQCGAALLLLLALADYADEDGYVSATVPALAERARVSPRHVTSLLASLVKLGEIELVRTGGGGTRASYRFPAHAERKPTKRVVRPRAAAADVREVFDYWRTAMHKNAATLLDATRKGRIEWALRNYSLEECKQAIDWYAADPFSMGQNDRHRPFNDLSLIFKDAPHFERFREQAPPVHEFRAWEQPSLDGCVPMPEEVKELMKGIGARF